MTNRITSDRPVEYQSEDRFQRYGFSKRIAETIISSDINDSIVIGVYGAWGEGKTSFINFIENELSKNEEIIPIRFNPWRFTEEATLLVSFFNTLASKIRQAFAEENEKGGFLVRKLDKAKKRWDNQKEPLKTYKETIGDILEKYGKIVSVFGAGEAAQSLGKVLSNVDVEILKDRFEQLLIQSKKKLVIFVDDIDRLDKNEIHSIFRLVKLTADFSNTIYVLSFDQEMVASAIGDRFGEGGKQAGLSFLEKIIQVPLKIPVAQPDALKQYCFELVNKAIQENQVSLEKDEVQRFVSEFSTNVLLRIKTPRLAVRYSNSLSFAFPLLIGEANLTDLMLIEAVKVFYPDHYEFIKSESHYFLSSYDSNSYYGGYRNSDTLKRELIEHFENLGHSLSNREKESIKSLLTHLFPRLDEAFKNIMKHNSQIEWYKYKRIASPAYFKRYFSYAVLIGEVSDISFDNFMASLNNETVENNIANLKTLIETSSVDNLLHKLRSHENDLEWESSKNLARAIALNGDMFGQSESVFSFGFDSPKSQAAIIIYNLLKNHYEKDESFYFAKELMLISKPFGFANEINNWLRTGKTNEEKMFNLSQYQELGKTLIDRAINESGEMPIFIAFPQNSGYLLSVWKEIEKDAFEEYIKKTLVSDPKHVLELLKSFTPIIRSNLYPEPYQSDFTKEQYAYFNSIFDREFIHSLIVQNYEKEIEEGKVKFLDNENAQTDINILRQYIHWFKKENEGKMINK